MLLLTVLSAPAQTPQNPSPMVDSTRAHRRIPKTEVPGARRTLSLGTLLLPKSHRRKIPLLIHFHGAAWLAEFSARSCSPHAAILTVHLGAGSAVYRKAFAGPSQFQALLQEAEAAAGLPVQFHPIVISGFSAGYGAIRGILENHANWTHIDAVLLMDGLHTSYDPEGKPGPLQTAALQPFLDFAREALASHKRMLITHSEIFPGTFASTTETTDFLIGALQLKRKPVVRWGPLGMQELSSVHSGNLRIRGFAGNTAPDHVDHFQAMRWWLKRLL